MISRPQRDVKLNETNVVQPQYPDSKYFVEMTVAAGTVAMLRMWDVTETNLRFMESATRHSNCMYPMQVPCFFSHLLTVGS